MRNHNPDNERIKHRYFAYLSDALGHSEETIDCVAKALSRFEEYTKQRDFRAFHPEQASGFKRRLTEQTNQKSGEKLSKATLHATLSQLKRFFQWLSREQGYRARVHYSDAEYFNLSGKDRRIGTAHRAQKAATLKQLKHVLSKMPMGTEVELRNRALIAFTLLTGARDGAIASMKHKHIDLSANCVVQDARDVKTKFSKTFTTYFFPVGDGFRQIVAEWVFFLREQMLWGNGDPLFPVTRVSVGEDRQFQRSGLERRHWTTATPIRAIFREAFERAGLPYFNPHSLRNTLVRLRQDLCRTPEQFKAWSQNLGHEGVLTTFLSYGEVGCDRQGEIIRSLATSQPGAVQSDANEIAEAVFKMFRNSGDKTSLHNQSGRAGL